MGFVVVGLSPKGDLNALRDALEAASLDPDRLDVIDGGDIDLIPGGVIGGELFTSDGGTSVPGITNSGSMTLRPNDSLIARLSDFNIPDSESDNYLEALYRGRSVVAYTANGDTVDKALAAFRSSGLLNVRQF